MPASRALRHKVKAVKGIEKPRIGRRLEGARVNQTGMPLPEPEKDYYAVEPEETEETERQQLETMILPSSSKLGKRRVVRTELTRGEGRAHGRITKLIDQARTHYPKGDIRNAELDACCARLRDMPWFEFRKHVAVLEMNSRCPITKDYPFVVATRIVQHERELLDLTADPSVVPNGSDKQARELARQAFNEEQNKLALMQRQKSCLEGNLETEYRRYHTYDEDSREEKRSLKAPADKSKNIGRWCLDTEEVAKATRLEVADSLDKIAKLIRQIDVATLSIVAVQRKIECMPR